MDAVSAVSVIREKHRGARHTGWRVVLLLLATAFLLAPHLVPAAPLRSFFALDNAEHMTAQPQTIETPGQTFPGSAFFLAEGAFTPAPDALAPVTAAPDTISVPADSAHVLILARSSAAPLIAFSGATALDRYRALTCLTAAIYYEGANEPDEGQRAIAQVVLNRVRHPAWPNSVCGVVYQGSERADLLCQFTFSCDGSTARLPMGEKWARAQRVAADALAGRSFAPVGMATYYHTLAVHPDWSSRLDPVAVVGAHIFYTMRGASGQPSAFYARYYGHEPVPGPAPRAYASVPTNALPTAMPYIPVTANPMPSAPVYSPIAKSAPANTGDSLPESTIRPEYRNTGRPLISAGQTPL